MKAFGEGKNVKFNKVCETVEKIQRPLQSKSNRHASIDLKSVEGIDIVRYRDDSYM